MKGIDLQTAAWLTPYACAGLFLLDWRKTRQALVLLLAVFAVLGWTVVLWAVTDVELEGFADGPLPIEIRAHD